MVHGADVYYVSAETYSLDYDTFQEHGLSICEKGGTFRFENFEFDLPDDVSQKILVKLYQEDRDILSTELRDYLNDENVEGFETKLADIGTQTKKCSERTSQSIKLEKKYLGPLEKSGYIGRKRSGRNNIISITESGKYVACIVGKL